ncbi:Putative ribonuclease H protein At1g65750 [Linum perenne]
MESVDTNSINLEQKVGDFVQEDGQWNINLLSDLCPPDVVDSIVGLSAPQAEYGEDQVAWGCEDNGRFTIKSAYRLILNSSAEEFTDPWKSVWGWKGPNRIRFFLWLAVHGKLLTNRGRFRRKMTLDASCEHCHHPEESVLHVIRDCQFAADVWSAIEGFT